MASDKNDYDFMKNMIEKMRENNSPKKQSKINEGLNVKTLTPEELEDEKNRFREAVGGTVEFGKFNIYDDTIEFGGQFISERIAWNFSLDSAKGCYISTESTQLSNETLEKIQKLKAYYDVWAEYWANELSQ